MISAAVWLLLVTWAIVVGRELRLVVAPRETPATLAVDFLGGLLVVHVGLLVFDAVGLGWTVGALAGFGIALPPLLLWLRRQVLDRRAPLQPSLPAHLPWGHGLALAAVLLFGWMAFTLRADNPDFIYHWGLKGRVFAAHGGIDWSFLARHEVQYAHPDYPNLLPELFAVQTILAGETDEPTLMLWTVSFLLMLSLTVASSLGSLELEGWRGQLALASVVLATCAFSIGYEQAGGPDPALALAALLGAIQLARPRPQPTSADASTPRAIDGAFEIGLAAAFAAAIKIEGIPLAAILIGLFLCRHGRAVMAAPSRLLLVVLPTSLVIVPWAWRVRQFRLFSEYNVGLPDLDRLAPLLRAGLEVFRRDEWHSLPWLLALVPLAVFWKRTRFLGLVVGLQLSVYALTYLGVPVDTTYWVLSSLPRLLLHVLPVTILALFLVADTLARPRSEAALSTNS